MVEYLAEVHIMEKFFDGFEVRYVPWLDNCDADHLAWISFYTCNATYKKQGATNRYPVLLLYF
jgi:hypothetical protein